MSVFKSVYFHRMLMYRRILRRNQHGQDEIEKDYRSTQELDEKMMNLIQNYSENNCIRLNKEFEDSIVLEVLHYDSHYIYARIGKQKDILSVHLRDQETLVAEKIDKTENQELEIFTYLLIDRENYIISYLREQAAPSIQELSKIISIYFGESNHLYSEISGVIIDDAIPILKQKDIIGSIEYSVTVPSTQRINIDQLGLTEDQFEYLSNQKSVNITVKLVAERNKDSFQDRNRMELFFRNLLQWTRKVKVRAKNEGEYMQTYDIENSPFTRREKFSFDNTAEDIENEIRQRLINVYETNKNDILTYIND